MEDHACRKCHVSMNLRDGCEWPDDPYLMLCGSCAIAEVERLRKANRRLRAQAKREREQKGEG